MNEKIVTKEYIEKFYKRYLLLDQTLQDLKKEVGFEESGNDVDRAQLRYGITQYDPKRFGGTRAIDLQSTLHPENSHTLVNVAGACVFHSTTGIEGMSQHLRHKTLFFALDPTKVVREHQAPPSLRLREVDKTDESIIMAKKHVADMLSRAYNASNNRPVTVLILDDFGKRDNLFALYSADTGFRVNEQHENEDTGFKHLHKKANVGETLPTTFDVDLYGLDTGKYTDEDDNQRSYISLSSKGLDKLYDIYCKTLGALDVTRTKADPFPILIYSADGLNIGPLIGLAFDLLHRFDEIFLATDQRTIMQKTVFDAHSMLRRSVSPNALSDVGNVEQAFHIAFALKMIQIERQCKQQLTNYNNKNEHVKGFDQLSPDIEELIKIAEEKTNYQTKSSNFNNYKAMHYSSISSPISWKRVPRLFFPEHYHLITTLDEALKTRVLTEKRTLEILDSREVEYEALQPAVYQ